MKAIVLLTAVSITLLLGSSNSDAADGGDGKGNGSVAQRAAGEGGNDKGNGRFGNNRDNGRCAGGNPDNSPLAL